MTKLNDKTVLITGGTGSFGNAFTDYLLKHENPKKIIIYSRDEFKQYEMRKRLSNHESVLRYMIGDVRDEKRLTMAMTGVDYVIHAAALKQVPLCEYNPFEAIKTNVLGAQNVIESAISSKSVKKVIALSTDKSVNPINLYGSSKMNSDRLFVAGNALSADCKFCLVRYGNVAFSRGSVIPLFLSQNQFDVDFTVTDRRMTRFWTQMSNAIETVLEAINHGQGGEVFVRKCKSFLITDLCEAINPKRKILFTGMRESEKLHEMMITGFDKTYERGDYYIIYPNNEWVKPSVMADMNPAEFGESGYNSFDNEYLTIEEIRGLINENNH